MQNFRITAHAFAIHSSRCTETSLSAAGTCLPLLPALRPRIDTATVILPVKTVLTGQLDGPLITLPFLKIGRKPGYPVLPGQSLPDLVQLPGIFQRADRQRGAEIIKFRRGGRDAGRCGCKDA